MDNFKVIYKILKYLETAMDYDEVDASRLSAEALNVSENRRIGILEMLVKKGYVDGVGVTRSMDGNVLLSMDAPRITLKGPEYLQENSIMAKTARTAKRDSGDCEVKYSTSVLLADLKTMMYKYS